MDRCKADVLRDMLCGHAEAPYAQEIDNLLDLAHIPTGAALLLHGVGLGLLLLLKQLKARGRGLAREGVVAQIGVGRGQLGRSR